HSSPTFSPDGQVVYWGGEYSTKAIYTRRLAAGDWTPASIIYFSEDMRSYRDPFISPDGERLYFISDDALPGESSSGKENIWMMEKEGEGWGTPQPLPDLINAYRLHWTISVAANYNLYFSANEADIYISRYLDGNYTEPVLLDPPVNTDELEITPNIAPDESYLLFTRVATKSDPPYLFISYAIGSGWSEPQRIENIDYCISPIVTPDRQYVIYMSSPYSLAWRDTTFINELWP
ncbi:MAG: PD40 domain-containing protein, partial [Anaerolineaceae bacterium]|nr:PD40 domain-containing protein [Anaerolineaceae bacterium]